MPADKHHTHDDGSSTRAFTAEQKAAVIRVRKCKATDFYDILGLEIVRVTCTDGEIKKAYRKLSLLTHPDKNGYTGADEAFKMVSRAFQILSDSDKKSKYDKFGGDPDSRFGGGSTSSGASPFSGFAQQRGGARGPMFEEEISPEELFRQFFGGGGGPFGGPFGGMGGNGFVFNMGGGPGFRVHQFGGPQPRRRPGEAQQQMPAGPLSAIQGLLPLLLLVLIGFMNFFGSSAPNWPNTTFDSGVAPYTQLHTTDRLKVPYYANPADIKSYTPREMRDFGREVEQRFIHKLSNACQVEQNTRARLLQEAQGFWSRDEEKWQQAKAFPMPACTKLASWNIALPNNRY